MKLRDGWRSRCANLLLWDVLPDPGGVLSLLALILALWGLLSMDLAADGTVYGSILDAVMPSGMRGARLDVCVEAVLQSTVLVLPLVSAYLAGRHLVTRGDSLLPCFTLVGGGSLALFLCCGLVVAL